MIEIEMWVYSKPSHPSANEMASRMKQFEKEFCRRKPTQFLNAGARKSLFLTDTREDMVSFKRRLAAIFQDLNRFIDFHLMRYIVWRETRRQKQAGRQLRP